MMLNISPELKIFEKVHKTEIIRYYIDEEFDFFFEEENNHPNPKFAIFKYYFNLDRSLKLRNREVRYNIRKENIQKEIKNLEERGYIKVYDGED